jgi:subtilase family serine protease
MHTHSLSPAMFLVHFDACRAVPDVSAMSDAYVIVQHGANTFIGGTSAACPVVAGLISLLNSERMAAGALVWTLLHVQNSSLKC